MVEARHSRRPWSPRDHFDLRVQPGLLPGDMRLERPGGPSHDLVYCSARLDLGSDADRAGRLVDPGQSPPKLAMLVLAERSDRLVFLCRSHRRPPRLGLAASRAGTSVDPRTV